MRQLVEEYGSQQKAGDAIHTSQVNVGRWMKAHERAPEFATIVAICRRLHLSMRYFEVQDPGRVPYKDRPRRLSRVAVFSGDIGPLRKNRHEDIPAGLTWDTSRYYTMVHGRS